MITDVFHRMLWKEYRMLRGFWLSVTLLTVGILILVWFARQASPLSPSDNAGYYGIALGMTTLYALGCAATVFAVEREEGTHDFLMAMPLRSNQIFLPKFLFVAGSTVLLLLVLGVAAGMIGGRPDLRTQERFNAAIFVSLPILDVIAWGLFFSLLLRRPLVAACLAGVCFFIAFIVFTYATVIVNAVFLEARSPSDLSLQLLVTPRLLVVASIVAVDCWLARRWLPDSRRICKPHSRRLIQERLSTPPGSTTILRRLLWHEWRQSWRMLGIFVLIGILLAVYTCLSFGELSPQSRLPFVLSLVGILVTLMGSCVFLSDQERSYYRFFAEHAVSPRLVWFSRQTVWLGTIVALFSVVVPLWTPYVFSSLSPLKEPVGREIYGHSAEELPAASLAALPGGVFFALFVALAYASGQLASMLVRRGIVAGFIGVILTGVFCGWAALMFNCHVSWFWSVAPIPLILLVATWLRAPDWIGDRNGVWPWTRVALSTVLPVALLVGGVITYRIFEVPRVDPGFSTEAYAAEVTPAARETAQMYLRAADLLKLREQTAAQPPMSPEAIASGESPAAQPMSDAQDTATLEWLTANSEALTLTLAATEHPECIFNFHWGNERREIDRVVPLADLILADAARLSDEGELDGAFGRYLAALRLSVHVVNRQAMVTPCQELQRRVFGLLSQDWSTRPGQTPATIHRALTALASWHGTVPSASEAVKAIYTRLDEILSLDPNAQVAERGILVVPTEDFVMQARLMPWELLRARRVLDAAASFGLKRAEARSAALAHGEAIPDLAESHADVDSSWQRTLWLNSFAWLGSAALNDPRLNTEFRALQLLLALQAWRLEHGDLPESLDELVGPYFNSLPLDPYSGMSFRYFPRGLEVTFQRRSSLPAIQVPADTPFVWSMGEAQKLASSYSPDDPTYVNAAKQPVGRVQSLEYGFTFLIPPTPSDEP